MPKYPPDILIFGAYQRAWINYMSVFSCNTVCFHFTVILIVPDYVYFFNKICLFLFVCFDIINKSNLLMDIELINGYEQIELINGY